jgi:uncharacterized protein YbjT (DUF2867 family)
MTNPRIFVTGATGKTASLVVAELLKAGYPVRATVHRGDTRSARTLKWVREFAQFVVVCSALASISTGTTVNCDGHCPRSAACA